MGYKDTSPEAERTRQIYQLLCERGDMAAAAKLRGEFPEAFVALPDCVVLEGRCLDAMRVIVAHYAGHESCTSDSPDAELLRLARKALDG